MRPAYSWGSELRYGLNCEYSMATAPTAKKSVRKTFKQDGVRLTRQRKILLDLLDKTGQHLDAERLYQLAREKDPGLNRVTVYRTLKLLKEGGLVDELDLMHQAGEQHYYETRRKQEHAHIICLGCGKVEEFFGEPLQKMRKQIESHFGFQIVLARTEVGGYCSHCRAMRAQQFEQAAKTAPNRNAGSSPQAMPAASATLSIVDPNGRRTSIPLYPFPFRMGRAPDNNLVLRDSRISRNHAQILMEDGQYILEDLASRHGVWVNGVRIGKTFKLTGGEKIEFGVPDGYQVYLTPAGTNTAPASPMIKFSGRPARAPAIWRNCGLCSKWRDRCKVRFRPMTFSTPYWMPRSR